MLQVPNNGENILNWARQATKEINSNIIHNGIGIRVLRSPQGTNLSLTSVKKTTSAVDGYNMPFDVIDAGAADLSGVTSERRFEVMTCGSESNVIYTIGKKSRRISPWEELYRNPFTVTLPIEEGDKVYFVVVFQYENESSGYSSNLSSDEEEQTDKFPINYILDTEEELTDDKICDEDGFKMIPFAYVERLKDNDDEDEEEGEEGGDEEEGEGEEEEEEEEEEPPIDGAYRLMFTQDEKNYALVQLYHGDLHLEIGGKGGLSTCSVGTVTGGEGGTFTVEIDKWDGTTEEVRVCACDLACTSMIPDDTKIIAHPIETRYVGE